MKRAGRILIHTRIRLLTRERLFNFYIIKDTHIA